MYDKTESITHHVSRITYYVFLWLITVSGLTACVPEVVQHNEAGNEHFAEQAYEPAIEAYKLAQISEPDLAVPYYNAANAYNRMSQVETAQLQTEQALKTADPALAAQAWYNLGNAYFDAQQWMPAIEAYQEALRLQPNDQDAKHNLELALQNLEMQQQEQQEQQEQTDSEEKQEEKQQEQSSQEEQEGSPEPQTGTATPTPGSESTESQTDQDEQQEEQTPQTAEQTLQEYLQEIYQVPGPAPEQEQDW